MNRDQIRGASRHLKGRAETALGGLTGDPARQVRGAVNQVAGGAQYAYGQASNYPHRRCGLPRLNRP